MNNLPSNYNLCTDYKLLWELIKQNHRIAGWILYEGKYWDIVEIRNSNLQHSDLPFQYSISVRGIQYGGIRENLGLEAYPYFLEICKEYNLHFILPNKLRQLLDDLGIYKQREILEMPLGEEGHYHIFYLNLWVILNTEEQYNKFKAKLEELENTDYDWCTDLTKYRLGDVYYFSIFPSHEILETCEVVFKNPNWSIEEMCLIAKEIINFDK